MTIRQLVTKRAFLDKTNYKIEAKLLTIEALGTGTFFVSLSLTVRFNYVGSENIDSGSGETLNLIVTSENGGFKVVDAYAPYDWFDERMRGHDVTLKQAYKERKGSSLPAVSEILDAAKKYEDYLNSYYDGLDQLVLGYHPGPSGTTPVAAEHPDLRSIRRPLLPTPGITAPTILLPVAAPLFPIMTSHRSRVTGTVPILYHMPSWQEGERPTIAAILRLVGTMST